MAYNSLAQADRDVLSERSISVASGSPQPDDSFHPISMDLENMGGDLTLDAETLNVNSNAHLGSLMRSMASTGTSYDMLEDDDYEDTQETPVKNESRDMDLEHFTCQPHSSSPNGTGRTRTASIGPKLSLKHPNPDVQSVLGASVKNIEHLEESAERLSISSSLDAELQRMKFQQGREYRQSSAPVSDAPSAQYNSAASLVNSVINVPARSAGYSSSRHVTSPKVSMLSGSWYHTSNSGRPTSKGSQLAPSFPENDTGRISPENARQLVSSGLEPPQPPPPTYQRELHARGVSVGHLQESNAEEADGVRPSTSASDDTYHQATDLFVDFDGVHHTSHPHLSPGRQVSMGRQIATNQPPLAVDAATFTEPPPGDGMVYYPAPVPMMLNLPQRLSKQPSPAEREMRRLKALSVMPSEMRKSAAWLNQMEKTTPANGLRTSQAISNLPPQLRASAFFDQPGLGQDIDIKCASAVDTLDSILDASAHAPVSAFTDHPIAGHLGREVYGAARGHRKAAKRRSSVNKLLQTHPNLSLDTKVSRPASPAGLSVMSQNKLPKGTSMIGAHEGEPALANGENNLLGNSAELENAVDELTKVNADDLEGEDEQGQQGLGKEEDEGDESDIPAYSGPPTTLLAELQMRKAQQRLRNRTAANAFPNGMHSTLLELDAVAQLQQKSREKKQITLAWEDHDVVDSAALDDEDVPLGLLVAGQKTQESISRPMGLLEKRNMEDNEPLSRRRARLKGDHMIPPTTGPSLPQCVSTMCTVDVPALKNKVLEEHEGETLAQRIQRMKAEKWTATRLGAEFDQDVSSQLELKTENVAPAAMIPEGEESLSQRRKRLQQEDLKNVRQPSGGSAHKALPLKPRSSMADILSEHPAGGLRQPSNESKGLTQQPTHPRISGQYGTRLSYMPILQQPMANYYTAPGILPSYPSINAGIPYMNGVPGLNYNSPAMYSPGLAMQMGGYGQNAYLQDSMMMGPALDPNRRDMIDRWRQDVAPS